VFFKLEISGNNEHPELTILRLSYRIVWTSIKRDKRLAYRDLWRPRDAIPLFPGSITIACFVACWNSEEEETNKQTDKKIKTFTK